LRKKTVDNHAKKFAVSFLRQGDGKNFVLNRDFFQTNQCRRFYVIFRALTRAFFLFFFFCAASQKILAKINNKKAFFVC